MEFELPKTYLSTGLYFAQRNQEHCNVVSIVYGYIFICYYQITESGPKNECTWKTSIFIYIL